MAEFESNLDRLEAEGGFQVNRPVPEPYEEVFEQLSGAEIELLVSIKRQLDQAQERVSGDVGSYDEYVVPPF